MIRARQRWLSPVSDPVDGSPSAGMLLWQGAKRAVSISTAAQIAAEAVQRGAQPVAVFVDEDADTIVRVCSETGISTAQLHGDGARAALSDIPPELQVDAAAMVRPHCCTSSPQTTCQRHTHTPIAHLACPQVIYVLHATTDGVIQTALPTASSR